MCSRRNTEVTGNTIEPEERKGREGLSPRGYRVQRGRGTKESSAELKIYVIKAGCLKLGQISLEM